MGYSSYLSEKALNHVRNSSIEDAMDYIMELQDEEPKIKPLITTSKEWEKIKPTWECKLCRYSNMSQPKPTQEPYCTGCGAPPNTSSYYTSEEFDTMILKKKESFKVEEQAKFES